MNPEKLPRNEYVEGELEKMLDDANREFEEMKEGIAASKFTTDQCIALQNKIQAFFVDLTNEGLRADKTLTPKSESK